MNLDSLISFCGWAGLTFVWFNVNMTFVTAIEKAILQHNRAIRRQALDFCEQNCHSSIKQKAYREGFDSCYSIYARKKESEDEEEEEEKEEES